MLLHADIFCLFFISVLYLYETSVEEVHCGREEVRSRLDPVASPEQVVQVCLRAVCSAVLF
jgi:hypothetical protein